MQPAVQFIEKLFPGVRHVNLYQESKENDHRCAVHYAVPFCRARYSSLPKVSLIRRGAQHVGSNPVVFSLSLKFIMFPRSSRWN